MVVIIMQNVGESLRGELTRYMLELKAGVFVGELNLNVANLLWEKIEKDISTGGAMLLRNDNSEQGYSIQMTGFLTREVEDYDGISLIKYSNSAYPKQ